jgi:hypothetical protein
LLGGVAGVDVGDAVAVSQLPAWLPPDDVQLMVQGSTEYHGDGHEWSITWNCTPGGPWEVFTVGDPARGRIAADGFTLAGPVNTTATTLSVARTVASTPLWITSAARPADFPFHIDVAGERMVVTAITGGASPQTFTVARSVNGVVKSHTAGTVVQLWQPAAIAL